MSNSGKTPAPVKQLIQMQGSTFAFRKRWGRIDWRSLASVNVERISREMDLQTLQQNIVNVTFCDIELEDFHSLDPNFLKLFRLAQLIIEYLLHSQQYLSEQNGLQEEKLQAAHQDVADIQRDLHSVRDELKAVKKENRRRKKVIQAYQDMINAGAVGLHTCKVCSREFVSAEYLQSHMHRRHPEYLTCELNGVTERDGNYKDLEKKLMENMTKQLKTAETELGMKIEKKEKEVFDVQARQIEQWKEQQNEKIEEDLRELQQPIMSQLREVQHEKAQLEKELLQKQAELDAFAVRNQSHLGHLEDSKELCVNESKCQAASAKAEVEHLKQKLDSQVQDWQSSLHTHERKLQKKIKNLLSTYQDQLNESMVKVDLLEQRMTGTCSSHSNEHQVHTQVEYPQQNNVTQKVPGSPPLSTSDESIHHSLSNVPSDEADGLDQDSPTLQHCKFQHQPDVVESVKKETNDIFYDALLQRGIMKYATGLSDLQLDMKLAALRQERQKRIQTHYNFMEHRKTLAEEIMNIKTSHCVNNTIGVCVNSKPGACKTSQYHGGVASTSKPPKPTVLSATVEQSALNPAAVASGNTLSVSSSLSTLSVCSNTDRLIEDEHVFKPEPVLDILHNDDDSCSFPPASFVKEPTQQLSTRQLNATEVADNSPWDSENDESIEKLAAPQKVTVRVSSTPKKNILEHHLTNIDQRTTPQSESINLLSFKGSESKPVSRTATSRSALTTVSIDDFMDSELSDLDIM